jgi:hypothetical protein
VSDWRSSLAAKPTAQTVNRERFGNVIEWVHDSVPAEDTVNALCTLREHMMQQTMQIARVLDVSEY